MILSHRKAWRRLLRREAENAVVLEDDAHVGEGFAGLIAADWGVLGFDLIKLETMFGPVWIARRGVSAGRPRAAASRSGAPRRRRLSRQPRGRGNCSASTRALNEPVDHMMFGRRAIFEREVRVLQLCPAIVVQDNQHPDARRRRAMTTTLGEIGAARYSDTMMRAKPRGAARFAREAERLIQQVRRMLRFFLRCAASLCPGDEYARLRAESRPLAGAARVHG